MSRKTRRADYGRPRRQRKGLPTSPEEAGSAPITKYFKVVGSSESKKSKTQASTPAQKKAGAQLTPDQKQNIPSTALTLTTPVEDAPSVSSKHSASSFSSPKPILCQSSVSFKQKNTKKKVITPPAVGDRVRVFYRNAWDLFGKRQEAGGWWFGSIAAVTKKRGKGYTVSVRFDDNTTFKFQYPSKVIQRLVSKSESPNIMYSEEGDNLEHFAYDSKPAILDVGDLVFCLYQNGKENGAWFRGRIAHVNEMRTHCDVLYDDGDYECRVPMRKGYIVLVQDGSQNLSWLEGVQVKLTKKGATRRSTARLKLISGGLAPRLLVEWSTGTPEEKSYADVVKNLFNVVKMEKEKIISWPERAFKLIPTPDGKKEIHRIPPETDQLGPVEEANLKPIETETKINRKPKIVENVVCIDDDEEVAPPSVLPMVAKKANIKPIVTKTKVNRKPKTAGNVICVDDDEEVAPPSVLPIVAEKATLKPIDTKTKINKKPQKVENMICVDEDEEVAPPSVVPIVAKRDEVAEESAITQVVEGLRPRPAETEISHDKVLFSPMLNRLRSRATKTEKKTARASALPLQKELTSRPTATGKATEEFSAPSAVATQMDKVHEKVLSSTQQRNLRLRRTQTDTAINKMSSPRVLQTLSVRSTTTDAAAENVSTKTELKRARSRQAQADAATENVSSPAVLKTLRALPTGTDTHVSPSKRQKVRDCVKSEMQTCLEVGPIVALQTSEEGQAILISGGKEMNASMTSSFWKALNTPEPHYGADILRRLTTIQGLIPSQKLCSSLIDMLTLGPTNGSVRFPDCNRVEHGRRYVAFLLKQPSMTYNFGRSSNVSFWSEWLDELSDLVYCVDSDEERTSSAALRRIGQSLHLKSCGLWLLSSLLSQSLQELKDSQDEFSSTRLKPVVRDFVGSQRRQSDALKNAIRATMWMWTTFGHYLSSQFKFPRPKGDDSVQASGTDIQVVAKEVRSIVFKLGEICSFLAILESMENDSDISDCKFKIRDTVEVELRQSKFDPTVFLGAPKGKRQRDSILAKHQKYIKLEFLLTLKGDYVGRLREDLADMFEVAEEFSLLC